MTERDKTSGESPLFARKGEAVPAPAVAFVSLRQLQGKPEHRRGEPDRRGDQHAHRHDEGPVDEPERRGPDHGGRRHFTPSSGLAFDQQFVPWEPSDGESDASEETAVAPKAKKPVSSMASLIHRHGAGELRPASPWSEPALAPERVAATASPATPAPARKPPLIDPRRALSTPASPVPPPLESPATPTGRPEGEEPPSEKRKRKRKKITVRLEREQFSRIKELAKRSGGTQQSVMAAAVTAYLNQTP